MAGLLDFLNDPSQAGLYALGSGLLSAKRGQEGHAFMGALPAFWEGQQNNRRNALTDAQLEETRAQAAQRQAAVVEMQRKAAAQQALQQRIGQLYPGDQNRALAALVAPDEFAKAQFAQPKEVAPTELQKLINERDKLPPGHPMRNVFDQAITKATTHTPATNVNVGLQSPYVGEDDKGNRIVVQPTNRPGAPAQILTDPRTGRPIRPPAPTSENKAPTEAQANATLYADRAAAAHAVLSDKEDKVNLPGLAAAQMTGRVAPYLMSERQQQVDQAQRNFVTAILRKESGAAISKSEFEEARKVYFPQPGDDAATIQQKKATRGLAIEGIKKGGIGATKNQSNVIRYDAQGNRQ